MNFPAPLRYRILIWTAFAGWAATIYYFSSLTGPEILEFDVHLWDKLEHFIAFTCGGILLAIALRWSVTWPWKSVGRFAILALCLYGALDETHQLFTANRSGADPFDWLADSLGALAGVVVCLVIYARLFRAHRPAPPRT